MADQTKAGPARERSGCAYPHLFLQTVGRALAETGAHGFPDDSFEQAAGQVAATLHGYGMGLEVEAVGAEIRVCSPCGRFELLIDFRHDPAGDAEAVVPKPPAGPTHWPPRGA